MSGALEADFNKETARLALAAAKGVLSGNTTPEQAAYAAMTDPNTAGRLSDVLNAIERSSEASGMTSPAGYTSGGVFGADNLGRDIHSFDPGQVPGSEYGGGPQTAELMGFEGFGGQYGGFAHGGPVNMSHIADFIRRQVRQDMARGGYVPGGSGGMDDDVPAVIDGNRPARLSSGEFVFDAATVAALGDGNNQAGARKLNQLRHAIRQKAYGHRRQPPKNYSLGDLVEMT